MPSKGALSRAIKVKGDVVPLCWPKLSDHVEPRPGYLVIILGAPGVGKSTLGLQWAYSLKTPALICSLDTDLMSQAIRVRAMLENKHTSAMQRDIEENPENWERFFSQSLPLVRWSETPMVAEDLDELLEAEKEFLGVVPSLVVVDVVGDLCEKEDLEHYLEAFKTLHRIARKQKVVVAALHHLKRGDAAKGATKFGLAEGLFGGERVAEIVLGMWQPAQSTVMIAVLKNRMGLADRGGDLSFGFAADLSRARIGTIDTISDYTTFVGGPA